MAKVSVGVYISRNSVDVVRLSGSFNKPVIAEHIRTEIEISSDEIYSSKEELHKRLVEAVKSSISKLKVEPDEIFSVLPEAGIMVRHFDMPILPASEQAQAIKFEARKYIPFKIEDVISDFKIIDISKEKKIMHIFFVAAQKADVELLLKIFQDANVKLAGVDIMPFALLRVFNINRKPIEKGDAITLLQLNTVEKTASINIIEANYPTISRDIPISQHRETLIERLVSELRLSFDYYKRKPFSKGIKKLVICGKDDLAELSKELAEGLNIATEAVDLSNVIKGAQLTSVSAIIAAGAAIAGLGRDTYRVNLLPTYARIKKLKVERQLVLTLCIAAALILFTTLYGINVVFSAKLHFKAMLDKSKTLPAATQDISVDRLKQLKEEELKTIKFLKSLVTKRIYLTEKLNRIAANLPEGVWLTSLETKKLPDFKISMSAQGKVFLKDASEQMGMADMFLRALKQDGIFMEGFDYCEFGNIRKETRDEYEITNYSVRCGSGKK